MFPRERESREKVHRNPESGRQTRNQEDKTKIKVQEGEGEDETSASYTTWIQIQFLNQSQLEKTSKGPRTPTMGIRFSHSEELLLFAIGDFRTGRCSTKHPGVGGSGEEQPKDISSSETLDDDSSVDEGGGWEIVGGAVSTCTSALRRDLRGDTLMGASCKRCPMSKHSTNV